MMLRLINLNQKSNVNASKTMCGSSMRNNGSRLMVRSPLGNFKQSHKVQRYLLQTNTSMEDRYPQYMSPLSSQNKNGSKKRFASPLADINFFLRHDQQSTAVSRNGGPVTNNSRMYQTKTSSRQQNYNNFFANSSESSTSTINLNDDLQMVLAPNKTQSKRK